MFNNRGFLAIGFVASFIIFCVAIFALLYFYQDSAFKYLSAFVGGTSGYKVYSEELAGSWKYITSNSRVDLHSEVQQYSGRYSLAFMPNSPTAQVALFTTNEIDPTEFTTLKLAARSSKIAQNLQIQLLDPDNKPLFDPISLFDYGGDIYPDQWKNYSIPLKTLDPEDRPISAILIQSQVSSDNNTFYIDELKFDISLPALPAKP